jgi:hypothetical protein
VLLKLGAVKLESGSREIFKYLKFFFYIIDPVKKLKKLVTVTLYMKNIYCYRLPTKIIVIESESLEIL